MQRGVWHDIVGQSRAVGMLSRAASGRDAMSHAWLITGPPGSGRSNAARAFAAALQCDYSGSPEAGCGECQNCTTTLAGTHPDVSIVATELLTISKDEVRALIQVAQRSPSQGRWRLILMEDADRMSAGTFNVLLKSIEEPPPRTVWLLCAPSPEDLAQTVRSRCRQVSLGTPNPREVAELLVRRDGIAPEAALLAARAAASHIGIARRLARSEAARDTRLHVLSLPARVHTPGDAVLRADELLKIATEDAKAGAEERNLRERAALLRTLGLEEASTIPPALRSQIKQLEDDQKRRSTRHTRDVLDRALSDMSSLMRDVLLLQCGVASTIDLINGDLASTLEQLAQSRSPEATLRHIEAMSAARRRIAANVAPLLALEAMFCALIPTR
ncbi:DNA polymerase III subunit delta' [Micrococcales bacterium 31B]|nr:DNA polymerase III subunit delta' [Micrococcales bacterium 31B]